MNSELSIRRFPKPNPVNSIENLRRRVERLFRGESPYNPRNQRQSNLNLNDLRRSDDSYAEFTYNVGSFLDFICSAIPDGDVYIFGGLIRDMAFYGASGFNSDVDIVVTKEWDPYKRLLMNLGARVNKFGGLRFFIGEMPVDLWHAEDTWAFAEGHVKYRGIASLLDTTILNWDAILMNWRSKRILSKPSYLDELSRRILDVVLIENPNPLGMLVRILRHLAQKDAEKITVKAANYVGDACRVYTFESVSGYEVEKFGDAIVESRLFAFFREYSILDDFPPDQRIELAEASVIRQLDLGEKKKDGV